MKQTIVECDACGARIDNGDGAIMRLTFNDARKGAKEADLCGSCADSAAGVKTARRGRKPKETA